VSAISILHRSSSGIARFLRKSGQPLAASPTLPTGSFRRRRFSKATDRFLSLVDRFSLANFGQFDLPAWHLFHITRSRPHTTTLPFPSLSSLSFNLGLLS